MPNRSINHYSKNNIKWTYNDCRVATLTKSYRNFRSLISTGSYPNFKKPLLKMIEGILGHKRIKNCDNFNLQIKITYKII